MSLLAEIKQTLIELDIHPSRRLGQNFTVHESTLDLMMDHAEIAGGDTVVEIGPGLGTLTIRLAQEASKVLAVELDKRLSKFLLTKFRNTPNVTIICGDFTQQKLPPFEKVVSNPPYAQISNLIFRLFEYDFQAAVLTVQTEFAKRLTARPGTKDYGRLTVNTYMKAQTELLETVPSDAFYPPPKTTSTIIRLRPKKPSSHHIEDWKIFDDIVRRLFTQKNRTLRKALKIMEKHFPAYAITAIRNSYPKTNERVYNLTPDDFGEIANIVAKAR